MFASCSYHCILWSFVAASVVCGIRTSRNLHSPFTWWLYTNTQNTTFARIHLLLLKFLFFFVSFHTWRKLHGDFSCYDVQATALDNQFLFGQFSRGRLLCRRLLRAAKSFDLPHRQVSSTNKNEKRKKKQLKKEKKITRICLDPLQFIQMEADCRLFLLLLGRVTWSACVLWNAISFETIYRVYMYS